MKYGEIGTVIQGTTKPEDLIPAFRDALESLDVDDKMFQYYKNRIAEIDWNIYAENPDFDEYLYDIVEELIDALNEYAPPHCYFGSHIGDGADYGFWMLDGSFDHTCKIHTISEGRNGESEFLDLDCNLYVEINDHGNVTVSTIDRGEEIFSIV